MWQNGQQLDWGWRAWSTVFDRLISVRQWNDRDRLARTGAADAWRTELGQVGDELIPFEAELWFRADAARRVAEQELLASDLMEAGGRVLRDFVLAEIGYHGVLAELPGRLLRQAAETMNVAWLSGRGVRFMRATGQAAVPVVEVTDTAPVTPPRQPVADRSPRVAVLDGVPVARHALLSGRILLDDPDGWEEEVEVRHRQHGTGMASAILHGDLAAGEAPLNEPIYVRPIIRVDPQHTWVDGAEETIPVHRLPVEIVHDAVVRMLGGENPQAPDVRIINISVGDRAQQFDRFVSPWARLLDHLSAAYAVLFVVSAGNHDVVLSLGADVDLDDAEEVQSEVLGQLAASASLRRLLAPAESVNALTVGGAHLDAGAMPTDGRLNPIVVHGAAAALSSWGAGHGRAIKPDILSPGGRELFDQQPSTADGAPREFWPTRVPRPPGIRVAAPSRSGDLRQTTFVCGTSPAAALATRAGAQALRRLDELRAQWGTAMPDPTLDAVLLKALIVHGARWGVAGNVLRQAMREVGQRGAKEDVSRSLGYGLIRPDWALFDDDYRVTAIYADRLAEGEHDYRLPLPPSLAGRTDRRRVTVTLAWITPVNVAHRGYRRAAMRVDATASRPLARERQEADNNAVGRGTVQHEVLEGQTAVPYVDGDDLAFTVTSRKAAGALDEPAPYAFVVTLETAEDIGLPIYAEVATRIRQRLGLAVRAPA